MIYSQHSEIEIDNKIIDHGKQSYFSGKIDSVKITNRSKEPIYIFVTTRHKNIEYKLPKGAIRPGQSDFLLVISKPQQKGKYKQSIKVYTRSGTREYPIEIRGYIESFDPNYQQLCPTFIESSQKTKTEYDCKIIVLDDESSLPIDGALIYVHKGISQLSLVSDRKGESELKAKMGLYFVDVSATGYQDKSSDHYFGNSSTVLVMRLKRKSDFLQENPLIADRQNQIDSLLQDDKSEPESTEDIEPDIITSSLNEQWQEKEEKVTEEEYPVFIDTIKDPVDSIDLYPDFTYQEYAKNNIVFLIDVSRSMGKEDRLEQLKVAMINLVDLLRPEDYVTVITYQETTNILCSQVSASEKNRLKEIINSLRAQGLTEGGKAVQIAYKEAKARFIKGGNNQIILASDGGFDGLYGSEDRLVNYIKVKSVFSRVGFSVLCFGTNKKGQKMLQRIVKASRGSYMLVKKTDQGIEMLENEIRNRSKR